MKKMGVCLLAVFFTMLLLSPILMSQEIMPPRCCPVVPNSIGLPDGGDGNPSLQEGFVISDATLALQGLTRSQFIDQLSGILFPMETVDLIIVSMEPILGKEGFLVGQILVDGQEYYFYKIPRCAIDSEDLDMLDQVGLTDGNTTVTVFFIE